MASAAKQHFDVLEFVKTSKALGVKEELAEYQARQFEQVIDIASANTKEEFDVHELATKSDIVQLKSDIVQLGAEIKQLELATKADIQELRTATKADIQELSVATKADIAQLGVEIKQLELTTKADIQELRTATKADIQMLAANMALKTEVKADIQELRTEIKSDIRQLTQKTDQLGIKIERCRYDALKLVIWTSVGVTVSLGGLLAKGFHWFG